MNSNAPNDNRNASALMPASPTLAFALYFDPPRALRTTSAFDLDSKDRLQPVYPYSSPGVETLVISASGCDEVASKDAPPRDIRFKLSIFGLMLASFLIVLDLVGSLHLKRQV